MSVLIHTGTISKDRLLSIQKTVDSITVPDGIGRIPLKIQSGFSRLTAEQLKNWTVLYSILRDSGMLAPFCFGLSIYFAKDIV